MSFTFERFMYKKRPGVLSFKRPPKAAEPKPDHHFAFGSYSVAEIDGDDSEKENKTSKRKKEQATEKASKKTRLDKIKDVDVVEVESSDIEGSENDCEYVESNSADVDSLASVFPHLSRGTICAAISDTGSLDAAADVLSSLEVDGHTTLKRHLKKRVRKTEIIEESDDQTSASEASEDEDEEDNGFLLSFFETAKPEELILIPSCSEKKAAKILELRPFKTWHDLLHKLSKSKGVSHKLIEGAKDLFSERQMMDRLMEECQELSQSVEAQLEDLGIQAADKKLNQPTLINSSMQLKSYQLVGLNWLITLHNLGMNGILADQMGLGKTAQAIAFLAHLIETKVEGPHAIIVPTTTVDNWLREIKLWLPSVSYEHYCGSQVERCELRDDILYSDDKPDIIVSSYSTAISTQEDRKFFRKLNCNYLILDEGHMVKNVKSQRYQHLLSLKARRKLLLTGTPLQNNLLELISLLNFVMPNIFEDRFSGMKLLLSTERKTGLVSKYEGEKIEQVKKVIKPFILRRLKEDVLQDLPRKVEHVIKCDVSTAQGELYKKIMENLKRNSANYKSFGSGIITELRKAACHPLLCRHHYNDSILTEIAQVYCQAPANVSSSPEYVYEDLTVMSDYEIHNLCQDAAYLKKFCLEISSILDSGKFHFITKKLKEIHDKGSRCLMFSQFTMMMDVMEPFLSHHGYRYLRLDGTTPVNERQKLIDQYNQDAGILVFLLSTRAGGMGINLTSADTVILHDIDFNPYNDKQAEDRCHRVGQTRDVTIYKLISKDTIEEGILKCAEDKLILERNIAGVDETDVKESVLKWIQEQCQSD